MAADWGRYVAAVGARVDRELKSASGFLALDFLGSAAADRKSLISGSAVIAQMAAYDDKGKPLEVRDGWVHDWRGAILLPGAKLARLFSGLQNEVPGTGKGDVLESSIAGRDQSIGLVRTEIKVRRTYVFTVVYRTKHDVYFTLRDATHGSSRSVATKIAQLTDAGTEYPAGKDDSYLLRWNSYWRYQEVPEGVIAECESVSLSKSAPSGTGLFVRPFANDAARESMEHALQNLKDFAATRLGTRPALSPAR